MQSKFSKKFCIQTKRKQKHKTFKVQLSKDSILQVSEYFKFLKFTLRFIYLRI